MNRWAGLLFFLGAVTMSFNVVFDLPWFAYLPSFAIMGSAVYLAVRDIWRLPADYFNLERHHTAE